MSEENVIRRVLERNYNLSITEARVYFTMIDGGQDTILKIAKATEINRSTVYLAIEELIRKDLAKIIIGGKKKYYLAKNPEHILKNLEDRKRKIKKIIPFLKKRYYTHTDRPIINFFEGKDSIRKVYEEALSSKKETLWYGSAKDMREEFPEHYAAMVNIKKHNPFFKGIRDIVNNTRADKEYAKIQNSRKHPNLEVRVLPKELGYPEADNIIYNNKLAVLSIKREFFVTVIESPTVVGAYRTMFELAWRSAERIK